jgi:acetolactate synthase small subunit
LVRDISVTIHILLGYERDILRELMLLVVKRTPEEMAYIKRLISGFYESILDHSNNDQFGMGNLSFLVSSSCSY